MIYNKFKECNLSRLGFGLMRLPVNNDGSIDEEQTEKMIDYAMAHGVNYYDTAWPYHGGMSELVCGKILKKYDRNSYYLASKFPAHQYISNMNVAEIFETQLKKCQVEYFDFYLLHNVYEGSIERYLDPKLNIIPYLIEQKHQGKIKHLGFSSHGDLDILKKMIELYGDELEFVQLQINYVDWTLQDAKAKYEYITSLNKPVWVMETVRGGKLAKLDDDIEEQMRKYRPNESTTSWALRYILKLDNVKMMLSGMSAFDHMVDNINTMELDKPLSDEEYEFISNVGKNLQCGVPCTGCKYCVAQCPKGLNIPRLLGFYNDLKYQHSIINVGIKIEAIEEEKQPQSCINCKSCMKMCPQKIEISKYLQELSEEYQKMPRWKDVCAKREIEANQAAKKVK